MLPQSNEVDRARTELIAAINGMITQTVSGIWHGTTASSSKDWVLGYIERFEGIKDDVISGGRLPGMFREGFEAYFTYNISNLEIWRDDLHSEKSMKTAFWNYVLALDKHIGITAEHTEEHGVKEKPSVIDALRADRQKPRQPGTQGAAQKKRGEEER